MDSSSRLMMALAGFAVLMGLPPCLGWINWFAMPLCAGCVLVGVVGLATDRAADGVTSQNVGLHTTAVISGCVLLTVSFIRWACGGGLF